MKQAQFPDRFNKGLKERKGTLGLLFQRSRTASRRFTAVQVSRVPAHSGFPH